MKKKMAVEKQHQLWVRTASNPSKLKNKNKKIDNASNGLAYNQHGLLMLVKLQETSYSAFSLS